MNKSRPMIATTDNINMTANEVLLRNNYHWMVIYKHRDQNTDKCCTTVLIKRWPIIHRSRPCLIHDPKAAIEALDPISQQYLADLNSWIQSIVGLILESHLNWGNQKVPEDPSKLKYGVSLTDACIDWKNYQRRCRQTQL